MLWRICLEIIFESSRVYSALSHGDRSSGVGMSLRDQLSNYKAATRRHLHPFPRHFRPVVHRDEVSVTHPRIFLTKATINETDEWMFRTVQTIGQFGRVSNYEIGNDENSDRTLNLIQPIRALPLSIRGGWIRFLPLARWENFCNKQRRALCSVQDSVPLAPDKHFRSIIYVNCYLRKSINKVFLFSDSFTKTDLNCN